MIVQKGTLSAVISRARQPKKPRLTVQGAGIMLEAYDKKPKESFAPIEKPAELARHLVPADVVSFWRSLTRFHICEATDIQSLKRFIEDYRDRVMVAVELPVVRNAYWHTTRYEVRELICLDVSMSEVASMMPFAEASRAVGRHQLRRLLPLRDQKVVRRYWKAVESGHAQGWHPVVFGMVLALFSLPLRQGLIYYGYQTLRGFIHAGSNGLALRDAETGQLLEELTRELPRAVAGTLTNQDMQIRVVG